MNKLKRNLKIFFLFSKYSLKTTFQGRMGPLFFIFGKLIRFILMFFLIFIIFGKTRLIKGYTFNQVIIFYLTFNLIDTVTQILFREVYRFRYLVLTGSLDLILTKPYHPFLKVLVGGIDFLDIIMLVPYLGLIIFFAHNLPGVSFLSIFSFSLLIFNSLLIATAFHIIVLALGILTTEVDHAIMIYRDMTSLGRFPMAIYQEPVRSIFTFVIPIGIMMFFPPQALFQLLPSSFYLLSGMVSLFLIFVALWMWSVALKKYQSWGG